MRHIHAVSTILLAIGVGGCVPEAVHWDEVVRRAPGALSDSLRMTWTGGVGDPEFARAWEPATWPHEAGTCLTSLRATPAMDGEAYASWFTVRDDSSVVLRVARSDDGGRTWNAAVTADSTDVGLTGCGRPAPFIAADSLNGYVHVVYHLVAQEGAGVFFTHTMERGALFHSPVPIVYGDRPSAATVASRGDTVVVAYEDPNNRNPHINLAISRTQGHIFERRLPASDGTGEARAPLVALRGDRVAVAWTTTQRGGGVPRTSVRLGTLAW